MTSLRGHSRTEFSQKVRAAALRRCADDKGIFHCEGCEVEITAATGRFFEHMDPDGLGGKATLENCQVRCRNCKVTKDKIDNAIMAKADRVIKKTYGLRTTRAKIKSKGFAKAPGQHSATRRIERNHRFE